MKHSALAAILPLSIVFFGVISAQDGPDSVFRGTKQFRKSVVVSGLAGPWELTWGPDNMLWVTERTGKRIARVNPATGEKKVAVTIDEVLAPGGQDGLMGLALDLGNNVVYTAYSYTDKSLPPHETRAPTSPYRFLYTKIVRLTYDKVKETLLEILPEAPPFFSKDNLSDQSERFFVAEIIREKILCCSS